ncbi:hypothetical protein CLOHYLEM_04619 [[Clostridium] hylemonae DSM 15053]|uniref:Uncharacterized protein n=1 Tax=[Clostridium] hylemonae DSM 15053 TaxID=553973 RepID=C0BXT2_9FIRM|nr:hypothetical protein CLOHYLEM_04619 [[Clostridium] hylemonae DSM 15053]
MCTSIRLAHFLYIDHQVNCTKQIKEDRLILNRLPICHYYVLFTSV